MTSIANSEDFARPQDNTRRPLGRPPDKSDSPPKNRFLIRYSQQGTVIKTRIKQSMTTAMDDAKHRLEAASGIHFSHTFLVRRALDLYLGQLKKNSHEELKTEALILKNTHR